MLKKIIVALGVLGLATLLFSFMTNGRMEACCAAATIPCVKTANQRIAQGHDVEDATSQELECLNDKLLRKKSEWRVLTAQPGVHAWRVQMTRDEMLLLKSVISGRHGSPRNAN